MRVLLFALSVAIISAEKKEKKDKIQRPGKLLGANNIGDGTNTCYVNCGDVCSEGGCEVFNLADTSLGKFNCACTECADGETGVGSYTCDINGIRDLSADDTSASCGGDGFDIALMMGRDDCEVADGTVSCPGTCQCESCGCNPCSGGQTCTPQNGNFGGFRCTGKVE